ncbi:AP-2 complex subunit sigma [Stylosanthes scabra]|uniref:AP-2 complex subunit sigma n=1 Tax=Stylosanthes scabra TaxID=79078 RepID=A0ABU6V4Y5_9FABA|nr:AP-2 complex subunit sigma [Stylosanthes scabra]
MKYYVPLEDSEKHKVEYEVHHLVVNRDSKYTNFVEEICWVVLPLCVDITDNELAYLECIHLFVEILDHFFSNVCELDLVFNFRCSDLTSTHANFQKPLSFAPG